MTISERWNI